jgi:hypothetical protein
MAHCGTINQYDIDLSELNHDLEDELQTVQTDVLQELCVDFLIEIYFV